MIQDKTQSSPGKISLGMYVGLNLGKENPTLSKIEIPSPTSSPYDFSNVEEENRPKPQPFNPAGLWLFE
ncbi:MAG: hypothetical protein WC795_01975 [Candidatus Paceibacterota bacterium]